MIDYYKKNRMLKISYYSVNYLFKKSDLRGSIFLIYNLTKFIRFVRKVMMKINHEMQINRVMGRLMFIIIY